MYTDVRGIEHTAASDEAVGAFERTINSYLGLSLRAGPDLKQTLDLDPEMAMAHCLKGYFFLLMGSGALLARARKAHDRAAEVVQSATAREQAHVKALGLWLEDRPIAAGRIWEDILDDHPRDVLAQRLAHHAHFYEGNSAAMMASLAKTETAWSADVEGYGYILGMRAFAHEEGGDYGLAEENGRQAVDMLPDNPWAIHAVAHVMEMQDRQAEGIEWITTLEPHWTGANNFRYHLCWHRALMVLDQGDTERALDIYDRELWDPESDEYLDLCNDVALLSRLELLGVDVGSRWQPLAEKIRDRADDHILSFIDAHFILALGAAGEDAAAETLLSSMAEKGGELRIKTGLPLCRALLDYCRGDYAVAAAGLSAIRGDIIGVGGSHAQRDLFEQIHIESCIRGGETSRARDLLETRTKNSPGNGLGWRKLSEVLAAAGDSGAAESARARAADLLASARP